MRKTILILLLTISCSSLYAEEQVFWPYGSAIYTNKTTWLSECNTNSIDGKRYRIGKDIAACVTKTPDDQPYGLVMSPASGFSKAELSEMLDSTARPDLPSRSHPRFKCLRVTSGWMC